ncbi:hypothetical protein CVM73_35575 [Bradyrhizobium forestalis]|uniref:Uncharacterized protein n=1 Tax=Bradyrhizobium forestalis TaxID=1419263 RepID=A0A2M8QYD1_9BRAD|nr:hypothetical protein CVM73_35575 [Bradyrhizobium forestalis]
MGACCSPYLRCHSPRKRGMQYAAASRLNHNCLWNTGSPAFAGDDSERVAARVRPSRPRLTSSATPADRSSPCPSLAARR